MPCTSRHVIVSNTKTHSCLFRPATHQWRHLWGVAKLGKAGEGGRRGEGGEKKADIEVGRNTPHHHTSENRRACTHKSFRGDECRLSTNNRIRSRVLRRYEYKIVKFLVGEWQQLCNFCCGSVGIARQIKVKLLEWEDNVLSWSTNNANEVISVATYNSRSALYL